MSLAESLERAAVELPEDAEGIRPANGDPGRLSQLLDDDSRRRVLSWLLENAAGDAQELAEAWLEETSGAQSVASIDSTTLPKEGRKVLRRLLHRARSRGLLTDEDSSDKAPHVGRLAQVDETISAGFLSSYDPRGGRLVYLVESSPSGGARVFEALLDESRGVVDFQVYRAGRRQVKSFIRDITHREQFSAIQTDADLVRGLLARRAAGQLESVPFPRAFKEWRNRLGLDNDSLTTPGEKGCEELTEEASPEDIEGLVSEVEEGRLGPWPPQPSELESAMEPVREAFSENIEKTDMKLDEEALGAAVRETLSALYSGSLGEVNAERLEESAYLYLKTDHTGHARACLASARALRQDSDITTPVVAACLKTVEDALVANLQQSLGEAAEETAQEEADSSI